MLPTIDLLTLTLGLAVLYAFLGVLSSVCKLGFGVLGRRSRRGRSQISLRVRRRTARPRHRAGAAAAIGPRQHPTAVASA